MRWLCVLLTLSLFATSAHAQFTWNGGGGTGQWSAAANWGGTAPPVGGGSAVTLVLAGTQQLTQTQNLDNPFALQTLTFASGAGTFVVSGNALLFNGSSPGIVQNASTVQTLNTNLGLVNTLTISGTGTGDLVLNGVLSGAGGLTLNSAAGLSAIVRLNAVNTFTGATLIDGNSILELNAVNALARSSEVTVAAEFGGLRLVGTNDQRLGRLLATSGSISLNSAALTVGYANLLSNLDTLVTGAASSRLVKVGTADLTVTANVGLSGEVLVQDGLLRLSAANGRVSQATRGQVGPGATLVLDNTVANLNRLNDAAALDLRGGTFRLVGNSAGTAETLGALTVSGQAVVQINPTTAGAQATFASLAASPTGVLVFRGPNLGNAPGAGVANVNFATAPALVGNILPAGLFDAGTNDFTSFVTVGANGVRPLIDAEYRNGVLTAGAVTDNVNETGSPNVAASLTLNSLRLNGSGQTVTIASGQSLTLTASALLARQSATIAGPGGLRFGNAGGQTAYISTLNPLTISAPVTAANLVKAGPGSLALTANPTLTGGSLTIAAGSLLLSTAGGVGGATNIRILAGGTLNVTGVAGGLTLASGQALSGNGSVAGTLIVGAGASVEASRLPGPGTLSLTALTLQPNGILRVPITSSAGLSNYDHGQLTGTGPLDLSGLSAANRLVLRPVSLRADFSVGNVSDFSSTGVYTWPIATFASIVGFDPNKFTVDPNQFSNAPTTTLFSVTADTTTLYLQFNVVPEPAFGGLLLLGIVGWAGRRTRNFLCQHAK
jgi:autotransporter-associated beta strand protein